MKKTLSKMLSKILFITFSGLLSNSFAQTVLIDPSNEGGFELPGGFAGNGWTVANNATGNQWVIGTTPIGFTNNSAFISNDAGVSNAYTNTTTTVVHFYRDVTIPAGETNISLSFDWLALGETGFWDALMVSVAPTTYTPTATTTSLGTAFLAGVTEIGRYWNQTTTQNVNINIPLSAINNCSSAQTVRLIFSWKNDSSGGTNPPAAVDNVSMVSSVPNPSSAIGTYTIDNTLPTAGTNFASFNEAIAWLNAVCISNPIVFNVTAGQIFTEVPRVITASGTAVNTITFQKSGSGANPILLGTNGVGTVDAGITISGGDYFTFDGIDIADNPTNATTTTQLEYGYLIRNASAINGAQFNIVRNCSISLLRTYTTVRSVLQSATTTGGGFVPTALTGANSENQYLNITVNSAFAGIYLFGTAAFADINCKVLNCTIGNSTANSIGSTTVATATFGIRADNQNGFTISGNTITNVVTGTQCDGINIIAFQGTCSVNNNRIRGIRNSGTGSTTVIAGIRATHTTTGTHALRIYNNAISNITSGYTGAASATRGLRGINISGTGGAATQSYVILNNSVSIDGSTSLNISSSCMEIATTSGPAFTVANNIFANFTGAQTGLARHYVYVSTSATSLGNTGTSVNNNVYFVLNDVGTTGFIGRGNTTDFAALANWQASYAGQDIASVSLNPNYIDNAQDLHSTNVALNGIGQAHPAYITTDLDNAARTDFDPGAYIINTCSGAPTAGTISGANAVCSGNGTTLNLTGASSEAGISYQWASSTTPGGPYSNLGTSSTQVTGVPTAPAYYVVTVTCAVSGLFSTTTEFTVNVNANPVVSVTPSSATYCNPGAAVSLTASGGALNYAWSPSTGLSATIGATVLASPSGTTTYTVTGVDGNGCIGTALVPITVRNVPTISSATATPPSVCSGGSSQLQVNVNAASVNEYLFTAGTGSTLDPMIGATTVITSGNDDIPTAAPANIGFSFPFNGTTYTQYSVSPDGWLLLGGAVAANDFSNQVTDPTNIPKIYPLWDDLATGTTGNVQTLVTGTAPNQIFIVQWSVTVPRNTTGPANSTFQAWLYESTGAIEFRYGTIGVATGTMSAGLTGSTTNFNSVTYATNTSSSVTAIDNNIVVPSSGTIYTFTPPAYTYEWSPATFLNSTTTSNPMAAGITSTITYNVTAFNGICPSASSPVTIATGSALTSSASITPSSTVCAGTAVTISATGIGGGAPYTYAWTGPNGFTSTSDINPIAAAALTDAGLYTVTVTDNCGATSVSTVTLTVNTLPVVSATPPASLYCVPGTGITLTASGASTFAWSPTAGLSATTGSSVIATPSENTAYTVTGTDGNGCIATALVPITVATAPTISAITATPAAVCNTGNSQLTSAVGFGPFTYCVSTHASGCSGDEINNVSLGSISNATGSACGGATRYTYFAPSATTTTTLSTSGGPYSLSLTFGTDGNQYAGAWIDFNQNGNFEVSEFLGASANAGASGTIAIPFSVPSGAFNGVTRMRIIGGNDLAVLATQACGASSSVWGETQDYDVTITNGVDPYTYAWSPATFLNSTTITNPLATGLNTTTLYTLSAIANGCTTTATVTVTANPLPTAPTTTNSAQCGAQIPTAAIASTTGLPTPTFVWYDAPVAGAVLQSSTSTTFTSVVSTTTTFYVSELNTATGCESGLTPVTITVASADLIQASIDLPSICIGQSVNLSVVNTNSSPLQLYTYSWSSTSGNGLVTSTGSAVTATPSIPGSYVFTVNGVDGGCNAVSSVNLTVNPFTATLAATNVTCFNAANGSFSLTGSSCGTAPFSYSVDGGAFGPIPTNLIPGTYSVVTRDANLFTAAAQTIVITQPAAVNQPVGITNVSICQGAPSAQLVYTPVSTGSVTLPFALLAQPTEVSNFPVGTVAVNPNIISSATMPALPADAVITSVNFTFNNITATGGSWRSDVNFGFNGAVSSPYAVGAGALNSAGNFNYTSALSPASVSIAGGVVNLHYFDAYNDNAGSEATFPIGANVASMVINYTFTPAPSVAYYAASTGGTSLGSGTPFETVGTSVLPNTNTPGVYNFYAAGVNGICESAARALVTVTVRATSTSTTPITACNSYTWTNGTTYTTSGTYTQVLTNAAGCDSTATLNLTINNSTTSSTPVTACDSYTWTNGTTYTVSGTYTQLLTNAAGCDSTASLVLTINNSTTSSTPVTACDSYTWTNGTTYTVGGTYTQLLTNAAGCDSTATLVLTINNSNSSSTSITACDSYTWSNGTTYTVGGTYTQVLTNAAGCDSTATLVLTINNSSVSTTTATTCDSYTWTNGTTYVASGTYTQVLTNAAGCDSTATLVLTINNSTASTTTITECDSYTWTNNTTYTVGGTYTQVLTNAAGCDSTATLVLTINNSTTGTDVQTACDSYTWIDGVTYTANNSTATFVLTNAAGCDSLVTLNLTITTSPTAVATDNLDATITASAGTAYQWIDCGTGLAIAGATAQTYTVTANGSYAVVVNNGACDDTSDCVVIDYIGIKEISQDVISVFPNPTRDFVTVNMTTANATIEVVDAQGKILQISNVVNGGTLSLASYETGMYIFRITTENGTSIHRISKN